MTTKSSDRTTASDDDEIVRLYGGWRGWCLAAGVVALYVVLAFAGHELGFYGLLSVWYPPAGLALAAGLIWGWRALPLLGLGELISGIAIFDIAASFSNTQMVINAVGYASIYVLAAVLLRRFGVGTRVDTLHSASLVLLVGVAASLGAALFGVGMQHWAGVPDLGGYWHDVGVWWIGDAIGIATVTPSLLLGALAWGTAGRHFVAVSVRGIATWKLVACLALPSIVAVVLFLVGSERPGVMSLVFAPVLFVALRFGLTGAALSTLLLAPVLTAMANETAENLDRADLQVYLLGVLVVALIVGVVVDERQRIAMRHQELGQIVEKTTDMVEIVDRAGRLRYLNAAGRRLLGIGPDEDVSAHHEEDFYADELSTQAAIEARELAVQNGTWSGDVLLRGPGGRELAGSKVVVAHSTPDGQVLRTASVVRDVTDQRRLEAELARMALEDPLTGLANRALFFTQLDGAIARAGAAGREGNVLLVKVDRFSSIRETFDASVADAALCAVGERLREVCGADVTLARIDAETFGVLSHELVRGPGSTGLAQRVIDALGDRTDVDGQRVPITVSVGIAEFRESFTADQVVRAAMVAVNRAEARGGSSLVFHVESMTDEANATLALETELRDAVAQHSWSLHYQPIVDATSGSMIGVEALLRFPGSDSPADHVVLAEENGLIVPLGLQILEQACRDSRVWAKHHDLESVHVNVSGRQLIEPRFVESVRTVLEQYPDAAPVMTIEVTETVMSGEPERASRVLGQLRDLGATIALDDFGTGYSSLATLHTFPIDVVKLDRAFTVNVATSDRMCAVVRTSIELAHVLGMKVVAEGVSEPEQLRVLCGLGCDAIQGYLISHPLSLDDFVVWDPASAVAAD